MLWKSPGAHKGRSCRVVPGGWSLRPPPPTVWLEWRLRSRLHRRDHSEGGRGGPLVSKVTHVRILPSLSASCLQSLFLFLKNEPRPLLGVAAWRWGRCQVWPEPGCPWVQVEQVESLCSRRLPSGLWAPVCVAPGLWGLRVLELTAFGLFAWARPAVSSSSCSPTSPFSCTSGIYLQSSSSLSHARPSLHNSSPWERL